MKFKSGYFAATLLVLNWIFWLGQKISSSNRSMIYFWCNISNFCPFFIQLCQKEFIWSHGTLYGSMLGHALEHYVSLMKGVCALSVIFSYTQDCHVLMASLTSSQPLFLSRLHVTTLSGDYLNLSPFLLPLHFSDFPSIPDLLTLPCFCTLCSICLHCFVL